MSARRWPVLAVLLAAGSAATTPAHAGFLTLTLSAGGAGSPAVVDTRSIQFTTPDGGSTVAVSQVAVGSTVTAATGGGTTFFGSTGVPVVLNLADGNAYLSSPTAPDGSKPAVTGLATAAPAAGGTVPNGAALLALTASDPTAAGTVLTAGVTAVGGAALGGMNVTVPSGGWWVLGLTPEDIGIPPPVVGPPPGGDPGPLDGGTGGGTGGGDPIPPPPPPPVPSTGDGGSVATPEPATLALAGVGLPLIAARHFRRRN
jgi:hypothetical protein